mmetsp:Transcript_69580/g.188051  ORF Transcript_69580/g.188051 Transcript_69580/m.188051 type:complete len:374 (+) Transcript_69580:542-1663(+)
MLPRKITVAARLLRKIADAPSSGHGRLGGADAFDGRRVVRGVEHCGAGDDSVAACLHDLVGVRRADAAVDLDPRVHALRLAEGLQLLDLVDLALDEALAAEAGVDGHDQDEVDLLQDVLDGRQGRAGVEDDPGSAAQRFDALDGPVQVDRRRGLAVDGYDVGPGLREVLDALLGLHDHEVAVHHGVGELLAERVHDQRPDGDVGHEAAVHRVDVDPVRARLDRISDLLSEAREVGREDGGRDLHGLLPRAQRRHAGVLRLARHRPLRARRRRPPRASGSHAARDEGGCAGHRHRRGHGAADRWYRGRGGARHLRRVLAHHGASGAQLGPHGHEGGGAAEHGGHHEGLGRHELFRGARVRPKRRRSRGAKRMTV